MAVLVMNNDQIREMEAREAEARRQAEEGAQQAFVSGLSSHIRACWQEAKRAKIPVERRILASKRQRAGEYEPQKLAAMKMLFGEDYEPEFLNITGTKCWHAEQWIREILFQPNNKPWSIEPTPSPTLPPEIEAEVEESVYQHFVDLVIADTVTSGGMPNMQGIAQGLQAHLSFIKDEVKREQLRRAREMLAKASVKVDDALTEGNWYRVTWGQACECANSAVQLSKLHKDRGYLLREPFTRLQSAATIDRTAEQAIPPMFQRYISGRRSAKRSL